MPVRRSSKTGKVILLVADNDASIQRDTCPATSNGLRALRWNNLLMPCAEKTLRRPTPQRLKVGSKGSLEAWSRSSACERAANVILQMLSTRTDAVVILLSV